MRWSYLPPPPGYSWLTGGLQEEYERLMKALEALQRKRAAADALEPAESDLSHDRSKLIAATIAALEAEIAVSKSIAIFHYACDRATSIKRNEAKAALMEVELAARERLGIPDNVNVPDAVLQNDPDWWAARTRLFAVADADPKSQAAQYETTARQATYEVDRLKAALADEAGRLSRINAAQQRELDRQTHQLEEEDKKQRVFDERDDRIAALLT